MLVRFLNQAAEGAKNGNSKDALRKLTTLMACCFIEPSMSLLQVAGVVGPADLAALKREVQATTMAGDAAS